VVLPLAVAEVQVRLVQLVPLIMAGVAGTQQSKVPLKAQV